MNRLTVLASALLTASLAVACFPDGKDGEPGPAGPNAPENVTGGEKPPEAPPASSGGPAASSSGGEPSTSSSGGTTSGSSGTPAVPMTRTGVIVVTQSSSVLDDVETNSFSAFASFIEVPTSTAPPASKCKLTKLGDCEINECDIVKGGNPPAGEPAKSPTASDITITAAEAVTLKADAKGLYTPKIGQSVLLTSNSDFKIKAKGAEVPAFEKTVKAPSHITVTEPEWPNSFELFNVDRDLPLSFTWTDGTVGDVLVTISSSNDAKMTTLVCKYKADKGTATIPQPTLAKLVQSETATIGLTAVTTQAFDQGDWKINVNATAGARALVGGLASGLAGVR